MVVILIILIELVILKKKSENWSVVIRNVSVILKDNSSKTRTKLYNEKGLWFETKPIIVGEDDDKGTLTRMRLLVVLTTTTQT